MIIQKLDEEMCVSTGKIKINDSYDFIGIYGICDDCGLCWMTKEEIYWYIVASGLLEPIYFEFE